MIPSISQLQGLTFLLLLLMTPSPVSGSQVSISGAIQWDIDYLLAAMSQKKNDFHSLSNHWLPMAATTRVRPLWHLLAFKLEF